MKRQGKHRRRSDKTKVIFLLILTLVLLAGAYLGGQWLDRAGRKPEARGEYVPGELNAEVIEVDGVTYRKRSGLTTVLVMGIDRDSTDEVRGFRSVGQADFLRLLVIDTRGETLTQIQIDRDTMTPITILGVLGDKAGVRNAQISLSHGFGDGGQQSCELTVEAVSNLLAGLRIDYYMALTMDGIVALNDMLGGVTVTLEQDLSEVDPALTQGATVTLMGDQAEAFVRSRMQVGSGTNVERMGRQEQYVEEMIDLVSARIREDKKYAEEAFDALKTYLTTDMSRGRLVNLAWSAREYAREPLVTIPGEHQVALDGFMSFQVDQAALQELVLRVFYEKVE